MCVCNLFQTTVLDMKNTCNHNKFVITVSFHNHNTCCCCCCACQTHERNIHFISFLFFFVRWWLSLHYHNSLLSIIIIIDKDLLIEIEFYLFFFCTEILNINQSINLTKKNVTRIPSCELTWTNVGYHQPQLAPTHL